MGTVKRKRPIEKVEPREEQSSFDSDVQYYKEHLSEFLAKYKGKYVAIINKDVVDCDVSFHDLATRVYAKYGYKDILMPKVEPEHVVRIHGPRLRPT